MSCNPNVLTVISPDVVDTKGFTVKGAVRVTAYGLTNENTVTFQRVHYCSEQPHFERNGCSLITPTKGALSSAIEYQIGTCAPSLTPMRNSLIIPYDGNYIPIVNGNPTDLTVEIEPVAMRDFSDKELGLDPCGFCVDKTWQTTGAERCNQHFVEQEEISNCGNVRWTRTAKRCGYYASVPMPITLDDGDCCGSQFMGYLFHPDETRDPDATVEIRDCDGTLHGYAYPSAGDGHTLPIAECGNPQPIGWAVNNSATAPQQMTGCEMTKPIYAQRLEELGCNPKGECHLSASNVLSAIQNADAETKQRLRAELAKCDCQEIRDFFGGDPKQS